MSFAIGLNKDSLLQTFQSEDQPDTARFQAINNLAWNGYLFTNPDSAYYFAGLFYELAKTKKNDKMMANALNIQGVAFWFKGEHQKAIDIYYKNYDIYKKIKDNRGMASSLNNLGLIYNDQGDYPKAIDHFMRSISISEKSGDRDGVANGFTNVGLIYQSTKQFDRAKEHFNSSLKVYEELNNGRGISTCLSNLGMIAQDEMELDKALDYFERAMEASSSVNDVESYANTVYNVGTLYFKLRTRTNDEAISDSLVQKSFETTQSALELYQELSNKKGQSNALTQLANIYFIRGEYNKSIELGENALKLAEEIGDVKATGNAASSLYQSFKKTNDHKHALETYEKYVTSKDSLSSEESQRELIGQEFKYQYDKQKALDDAANEKKLAVEKEAKDKQLILTIASVTGLILMIVFLVFVFNRLKVTRKQKAIIEHAHEELEEKNNEILDSIAYAKRIQSAILPPDKLVKEYLKDSFVIYKPKDIVAGDFYWMEHVGEKVLFAAADCTGHGVPGAMVSVVCNNGLNRSVREHKLTDPGKILDKTREIVVQEFEKSEEEVKDGMDIALCSLTGNILEYAGAHNPLWIIRKEATEVEEIKADKQPIGKSDNPQPHSTQKVTLQPGDTFYIFSDGYADQFGGEKGKKMKTSNFKKLLLSIQRENMQKQRALIDQAFEDWKGSLEQLDDVCVIGVRI